MTEAIVFLTKGYATEANARKKLADHCGMLSSRVRMLVAAQGDRFFPVVVLAGEDMRYARLLADLGIYVIG